MIYAFTGPTELRYDQRDLVAETVRGLPDFTGGRYGGAHGVDTVSAFTAMEVFPDADHVVIAPAAYWSRLVPEGARLEYAPGGRDDSDSYMIRNRLLVGGNAEVLVAFPRTPRAEGRSGTWSTVRRARDRGRLIFFVPLDGTPPFWWRPAQGALI